VGSDPLGRFAQNPDAGEANAAEGRRMLEVALDSLKRVVDGFTLRTRNAPHIPMEAMAPLWAKLDAERPRWRTLTL